MSLVLAELLQNNKSQKTTIANILSKAGLDWFILTLLVIILLAYIYPSLGVKESKIPLADIAKYGVSAIFFFYGLRLSPDKLKGGLNNWGLHLLIHFTTFIAFPLFALTVKPFFIGINNETIWLGIFYLAVLPSTVSSSVVMVSIAGGNLAAAIFNASLSSLLGIFVTPIWMSLFLSKQGSDYNLPHVISNLVAQVLIPVVLGILLYARLGKTAEKYKQQLKVFDQIIILLIVYTSFCESFSKHMFASINWSNIIFLGLGMLGFFILIFLILNFICSLVKFKRADKITALFCGSKKSLVQGTVMSNILFPGSPVIGIILLPIMIYHALQLIASSVIAQYFGRIAQEEIDGLPKVKS